MTSRLSHLSCNDAEQRSPPNHLAKFFREQWMGGDAAICAAPAGSMEISLLHLAAGHNQRFFRKFAPPEKPILALRDCHGSQNGAFWFFKAAEFGIEIAQSPANAAHFLQPCDKTINLKLKEGIKKTRGSSLAYRKALAPSSLD